MKRELDGSHRGRFSGVSAILSARWLALASAPKNSNLPDANPLPGLLHACDL
jgi:hypothetical protein